MAHPEHAALEDSLVRLVGEHLHAAADPADSRHETFFDWCTREAQLQQSAAERARTEADADAFAEGMLARLAARPRRHHPDIPAAADGRPSYVPAPVATIAQALEDARPRRCAPVLDLRVAAGTGRALWDEPCDRWVELPEGVPAGGYLVLTVAGDSMTPLLEPGDLILIRLGRDVQRGTVVVAQKPAEGYVVKQVGRVTHDRLELLSRNPAYAPLSLEYDAHVVLGTVVLFWRTKTVRPEAPA